MVKQSGNTFAEVLRDEVNAFRGSESNPAPPPTLTARSEGHTT
jgi:hypothetical protein